MNTHTTYPIIFAGAGPGDPDLITVKAAQALEQADLVLYTGSLVPESILKWTTDGCQNVSSAGMDLEKITDLLISVQKAGRHVVRLHTGDPSLYGAIFEQMQVLDEYSIPYQVIPGVTAAFASAAAMKMEYTLPEITQTLILTRISGRTPVPEIEDLKHLAEHRSSLAIYLSAAHLERVSKILCESYGPDALCAIAYKVSHPDEKIIFSSAKDLPEKAKANRIDRHALIIAGKAVETSLTRSEQVTSKLYDRTFSHGYRPGVAKKS